MTRVVSLLRGINVGGKRSIKMTELVDLYGTLGLDNPRSFIQSGNVVFGTTEGDLEGLARRVAEAIESKFGIRSEVILRTREELRNVVDRNPFAGRSDVPSNKLHVLFLAAQPGAGVHDRLRALPSTPEELHLAGRELYIYFPNGMGRPTLSISAIDRALGVPETARNWNTVLKLLELATAHSAAR
jgi:uncharacterized protein (DUF1697 family)